MSQAEAEGLPLLKADNKTGYFGVCLAYPGRGKPYKAQVSRGGKVVSLGLFATAEEAALCIARSPEGQAAAERASAAPPPAPLTSEEVRQQAEAEGLTLLKADNKTGYYGVHHHKPGTAKPYQAQLKRGGNRVSLGTFATAEEAALCIARSPEGQEAAKRAAAAPPLTSEEAQQQARAEGLTLLKADNAAGYFGVHLHNPGQPKPYQARVRRGGNKVHLGSFATAEEAALSIARSPEGQEAANRPAAAPPLTSEEAQQQARAEGLTLLVAENTAGYFGVTHQPGRAKPYQAHVWRGGKSVHLGCFATAEEAALCIARSPAGRAAAQKAAVAAPPLTSEETGVVELEAEVELVEAEDAEDVQWVVAEVVELAEVMEHEDVVDESRRSKGLAKRRREERGKIC